MLTTLYEELRVLVSLILGLGGSGQRTLDWLKLLILERLGVAGTPLVELLSIDVMREYQYLSPGEYLQLQIRGLHRVMARYPWAPDPLKYPRIRRLNSVEQGCGGIPVVGRLAFATNFGTIARALRGRVQSVAGRLAAQRANLAIGANAQRQGQAPIWIIASLFGGTGSGMVLDIAALAKSKHNRSRIYLLLFMPDCFGHDETEEEYRRGLGVGYTILRQLNHFLAGHEFLGQYGKNTVRTHAFIEQVYLVSGVSETGIALNGERGDPFRMAAEFLYDYIFTDLGTTMEARLLNPQLGISGVSSFGIHKLVHPVKQLIRIEKLLQGRDAIHAVRSNGSLEIVTPPLATASNTNKN